MKNEIYLTGTEFIEILNTKNKYGYLLEDHTDKTYQILGESNGKDEIALESGIDCLAMVIKFPTKTSTRILKKIQKRKCGIYINGKYHDWWFIQNIIDKIK